LDGKTVISHGFSAEKTGTRAIRAATVSRLLVVAGGAGRNGTEHSRRGGWFGHQQPGHSETTNKHAASRGIEWNWDIIERYLGKLNKLWL